jgi:uncharacterized protein (TIGR00255 family)
MLLSMTGFGEARHPSHAGTLSIEVRSVNNRYLKLSVRGSDPFPMYEADFERIVRKYLKRGTILLQVRLEKSHDVTEAKLNLPLLRGYIDQLKSMLVSSEVELLLPAMASQVLMLPNVASSSSMNTHLDEEQWQEIEKTAETALANLNLMRTHEGAAMARELMQLHENLHHQWLEIGKLSGNVAENYRKRLFDRVSNTLASHSLQLEKSDLIREVAIYADRSDIAEELTRIESHLQQFAEIIQSENDMPGRKLEFVTQEMAREVNTIGSKAGDVNISKHVVELKANLEKIRELVQNIE